MSQTPESAATVPATSAQSLSPWARAIAIFARPASAWSGLETRSQWWFPVLIMVIVAASGTALLHQRALMPMLTEGWDQQVQAGRMTAAQVQKMEDFFSGPGGVAFSVGQQIVLLPIITLVIALVVWFGVGFVLGSKMKYRHALEVAAWSNLINVPGYLVAFTEAWFSQTFKGLHVGLGALLPPDSTSKLMTGLGIFLDALGPFSIWYLIVGIVGAAALSGAPRRSVAWVMSSLYLIIVIVSAVLTAWFTPAS
ncbi:MAG: YIP1 family protein [Candidatus Eiseniibacteriota bacterium]